MADSRIFADVSAYLMRLLQRKLCPDYLWSPGQVRIAAPSDELMDYLIGINLYDVKEKSEIAIPKFVKNARRQLEQTSMPYQLYYLVYINEKALMEREMEQVFIGRLAQIFNDYSTIPPDVLQPGRNRDEPHIGIIPVEMSTEEKANVWRAFNRPYQISLFYRADPVFLSSELVLTVPVVTEASFGFLEHDN